MERVVVFGVGYECKRLLEKGFILKDCQVVAFVDSDRTRWGEILKTPGGEWKIISPAEGLQHDFDKVLITTKAYAAEVRTQLTDTFFVPEAKICLWWDITQEVIAEIHKKKRLVYLFHHKPTVFAPEAVITEGEKTTADIGLIDRIIEAYHRTLSYAQEIGESWWTTGWIWACKEHIHQGFLSEDREKVRSVLENPVENNLFLGFGDIWPWDKKIMVRIIYDCVIQVAAYLGIVRMPNPEYSPFASDIWLDDVLDQIAENYGFDLKFSNPFPGELGIRTKRGILGWRAIQSLYQAIRIYELLNGKIRGAKILEIGAGLGLTASFMHQMGNRDYTIIDIPMTNVAQEYFLGRAIGEERVSFVGEEPAGDIKILPFYMLSDLEKERYDLILNVDSITEMDETFQQNYWGYIQTHTSAFFSINHEHNPHTVRELYQATGAKVHRGICPLRRGYVEEAVYFR